MAGRLPAAPPILSGFTYVRPLGTGGFADVFLFEQNMPRRPVAVKVLLQDIVDDGLLRMFNAEADVMARLSAHPSILTIYQASVSADGRPYIVMEHCPNSMTNRYRRELIPVAEIVALGVKIGSALETAHRAGLLHRDIKPSNILMTAFGAPVLSDFGIAASINARGDGEVFAMSVPWSAPEVVDESISGSIPSEVWSLGATIYTLLAGRSPFEIAGSGQNGRDQLKGRIRKAQYTPIGRSDVPASLEALLQRSMSKDPARRQASAAQFAYELQVVQHEMGLPSTPLEIAVDEWAAAGAAIDFQDNSLRGPVRPTVEHASRRPQRASRSTARRVSLDGTVLAGSSPSRPARSRWLIPTIIAGAVAVGVAATVTILALTGVF
ncbi:MAG: serine/threonine protein kinase [Actinobacteria bacterium]|nr:MULTISPECIES: serine/threonine-protein kinase [unclassified Microbacterium]RUA27290.1 MAG: serine/threonine protein kinase [Actinomycetota bacterium]MBU20351.1 serine/threonine protein kinase [Microbacterium sp.]HAJ17460.1 serine/threonine protein kinase [Microbacterium sp.]HAM13012.1 serine/threonine protein kinase [Microbacterium sp.]HBS08714.1 serine/threonine protein kinase [Microbacterium sp.]|tara:strand:- start:11696 stop:12838 length:1143 start_codon:yes stop_codon:yes gene_type:complete